MDKKHIWFNLLGSGGDNYSELATEVIGRLTNPTTTQKNATATFVDTCYANPNIWPLLKEVQIRALGSVNGLVGLKGLFNATNNGATFTLHGANYDGASYIDTGFDIDTIGAGLQNNLLMGGYVYDIGAPGISQCLWGASNSTDRTQIFVLTSGLYNIGMNSANADSTTTTALDGHHVSVGRSNSTFHYLDVDGTVEAIAENSVALINRNVYEGARNNAGVVASYLNGGIISTFYVAESVGFDRAGFTAAVNQLLSDLGLFFLNDEVNILSARNVIAQSDDYMLSYNESTGAWDYSEDAGDSWSNLLTQNIGTRVNGAHMFTNGNTIVFTESNAIYLVRISNATISAKTCLNPDDSTYTLHTPANASYPGNYFTPLMYYQPFIVSGVGEMWVWGNLSNTIHGASPVNLYYTVDQGETIKVAYKFGRHARYRDDGTSDGGFTGTQLGEASNPLVARHVHDVNYCAHNGKWYAYTGDVTIYSENHFMEGTYNSETDEWSWTEIVLDYATYIDRYQHTAGGFNGEYYYWCAEIVDGGATFGGERGIWRSKISEFNDPSKHEQVISFPTLEYATQVIYDWDNGVAVGIVNWDDGVFQDPSGIFLAKNFPDGPNMEWVIKDFKLPNKFNNLKFRNSKGEYVLWNRWWDEAHTDTVIFKPL